jgi:acetylornithine deacetylase/succinyl-diaminopimelate desuccinylase-like protein
VIFGPGDIGVAHQPDEYIEPAQLVACETALQATIARFCTRRAR